MKLYALSQLTLLTTASLALSIPTSSPLDARTSIIGGSLGDGYYHVSNVNNATNLVSFTPIAEMPHLTAIKEHANSPMPLEKRDLEKRGYYVCTGWTLSAADTLSAQSCLRNAAESEGQWQAGHWAFCKVGGTMAYACAYSDTYVCSSIVNSMEVGIDDSCGWPTAGYVSTNPSAASDGLAVGRTFSGDHFCTSSFVGW